VTFDHIEPIDGPYGTVRFVPYPDPSEGGYEEKARAAYDVARGTWLINSPIWHLAWKQYVLSVISLEDHPDLAPASLKFVGATHQMFVMAIDPGQPQTVETVQEHCKKGGLPFLTPINIAEQFECTDDEIRQVAWLAARAVVHSQLAPEPPLGYESFRMNWLAACTKALAHIRGEAHSET
jgi:hypothetical protein